MSENFAWGWARQFYHVDAVRTYLWKETHSGMNVFPVSCKWRLSYFVWNQSTSTFSKSLKLELIYLVINKSGQLPNLFVCVIFLIRFEVSQPTPTLPLPLPPLFLFPPIPHSVCRRVKKLTDFTQIMVNLQLIPFKGFIFASIPDDFFYFFIIMIIIIFNQRYICLIYGRSPFFLLSLLLGWYFFWWLISYVVSILLAYTSYTGVRLKAF